MEREGSYFDMYGNEIQEADLLKVWHFREAHRRKIHYMYHIATLEEFNGKLYWGAKEYHRTENKGHYNLRAVANKETRIINGCQVIDSKDAFRDHRKTKPNRITEP